MPIILSCDILSCTYFYLYIDWIHIFQSSSTQATILPSAPGNTLSSDEIWKINMKILNLNIKFFNKFNSHFLAHDLSHVQSGKKILIINYFTYLFFDHAKFLIYRFKMKSVKSGSIKKYFEISQGDFTNFLVDTRHERSDWTISKVQNFGGGWSCWSWKQKSIIKIRGVNLAIFMSCMRWCEMRL